MTMPSSLPNILPPGEYRATILAEAEEKTSKYDPQKTYFQMPLELENTAGETFEFRFCFSRKHPQYAALLKILGGKTDERGITSPPRGSVEGRTFRVTLVQRPHRQDPSKTVNEIVRVAPLSGELPPSDTHEEGNSEIPF
jgi:hypothetical protein